MALLTDTEIAQLMAEPKHLPADYMTRLQLRPKRGHRERELDVEGDSGSRFRIIVRESDLNPLDFSVILAYYMATTNRLFRLRRYNGRHGEHTNRIENQTFAAFHIHLATERYQDLGAKEEAFAQVTDRYATVSEAMACMVADCSFVVDEPRADSVQLRLLPQELS